MAMALSLLLVSAYAEAVYETECVERLKETMLRMLGKCRSKAVRGLWLRITKFFEKE